MTSDINVKGGAHGKGFPCLDVREGNLARAASVLGSLFGAIAVGAVVRVYLAWTAYVVSPDSALYLAMARRMAADWRAEIAEAYPLGFPFMIRIAHALCGQWLGADAVLSWQHAGQMVSLVFGIACIPLVFALGARLIDAKCGLVAAFIWALLPSVAHSSADVLSDMPNLALMLMALLLVMRGLRKPAAVSLFFAGLVSGAAYTIRTEGGEPAFVAVLLLLTLPRMRLRRRLIGAAAVVVGFAIFGGSYIVLEGGRIINKQSWVSEAVARRSGPALSGPERDPQVAGARSIGTSSATEGGRYFRAGIPSLGPALKELISSTNDSVNTVWLVLAGLYFFLPMRRRVQRDELRAPLALWSSHTAILIWLFMHTEYISGRHTFLLDVGIVIFAAGFLVSLTDGLRSRGFRLPNWSEAATVAVIGAALSPWLFRQLNRDRHYVREAGQWIAREYAGRPLPKIISRDGRVPYYAGATRWMTCYSTKDVPHLPNAEDAELLIIPVDFDPPGDTMMVNGRRRRFIEDQHFMDRRGKKGVVIFRMEDAQPVAERSGPP